MKNLSKLLILSALFTPALAIADEVTMGELFEQIVSLAGSWKALGTQAGIAAAITLLVSTMKNSFLREKLWSRLGWKKVLVAPALSLVASILALGEISLATVFAALTTGAAAVYLHELLDGIKEIPGIGETWKKVVDVIGRLLGREKEKEEKE